MKKIEKTVGKIFGKSIKDVMLPQLFLIINASKTESGLHMPLGYVGSTSLIYFKKKKEGKSSFSDSWEFSPGAQRH